MTACYGLASFTDWRCQPRWTWVPSTRRGPGVASENGGSEVVAALETVYRAIRADHPELPDVVLITGSGLVSGGVVWGHFARDRWLEAVSAGRRPEMFVGGERLACGAELTVQTMLHECAHAVAAQRGVQDCSRQNRYHNGTFRAIAAEMGLDYPADHPCPSQGYSAVVLSDKARHHYAAVIATLGRAITLHLDPVRWLAATPGLGGHGVTVTGGGKGTGGTSASRVVCQCTPPRIIRVSRSTLAAGPIGCGICGEDFTTEAG